MNLNVSRVTGFPKFPNTSPSGKRVDSDDPIPRTFQNFSQKRHPRNVGGDTRHPETSQRSNRGAFAELLLLAPINRRLPLSNFFSPFSCFVANCSSLLRGNLYCILAFAASNFLRTFLRYYSFLSLNSCFFFPSY
jgi:hypothetical protein